MCPGICDDDGDLVGASFGDCDGGSVDVGVGISDRTSICAAVGNGDGGSDDGEHDLGLDEEFLLDRRNTGV